MIPPVPGYRRHITSLQANAAHAARCELNPTSSQVSAAARNRLSVQLRQWCDDFYDTLSDVHDLPRHVTPDTLWWPPTDTVDMLQPECAEEMALHIHAAYHIDWTCLNPVSTGREDLTTCQISDALLLLIDEVSTSFPAHRTRLLEMLTRTYTQLRFTDAHALNLTESLIRLGLPSYVREHIARVDRNYNAHRQIVLDRIQSLTAKVSFAIKCGDVAYVAEKLESINPHRAFNLLQLACETCDLPMFELLRQFNHPRMHHMSLRSYMLLLSGALHTANHPVQLRILAEMNDNDVDWPSSVTDLWEITHDVQSAIILNAHGCPHDTAVFHCPYPDVVRYLISLGPAPIPSTVADAASALSSNSIIANLLIDAWNNTRHPVDAYLLAAIRVCRSERVLTELVGIFNCQYNSDKMADPVVRECVTAAFLNADVDGDASFFRTCLALGADINRQHSDTGMTVLMDAVFHANVRVVKFLVDEGASTDVRDADGLTAVELCDLFVTQTHPHRCELILRHLQKTDIS